MLEYNGERSGIVEQLDKRNFKIVDDFMVYLQYGKVGMLFLHSKLMHKNHWIEYLKIYQQAEQMKNCQVK